MKNSSIAEGSGDPRVIVALDFCFESISDLMNYSLIRPIASRIWL